MWEIEVGFFNADKEELSPEEREELSTEERIKFLEEKVELLRKAEEHFWDAAIFTLFQIHTITLALQEKGVVGASELEETRNKTLEAIRRVEKVKDNGG